MSQTNLRDAPAAPQPPTLETVAITVAEGIATVSLARPDKANAMNLAMWHDIRRAFDWVDGCAQARVVVLEGQGRSFCAGIDLAMFQGLAAQLPQDCEGRRGEAFWHLARDLQDTLTSLERCRKPVLAAIHGACVGGGVDLVCCADLRLCSADAHFAIKEIDIGMVADVGTLQRLPKLVAPGLVREWAYTGRRVEAAEARACGFVNQVFDDAAALQAGARALAAQIAAKSPLAIRGTKQALNYARDHSVADGLEQVATWNAGMIFSADLQEAALAAMGRRPPRFQD